MFTRRVGACPSDGGLRSLVGGWFLLLLLFQAACATGAPRSGTPRARYQPPTPPPAPWARLPPTPKARPPSTSVYALGFLEPGSMATRPVPIDSAAFQRAFLRLSRDMKREGRSPREVARSLLRFAEPLGRDAEHVEMEGLWLLEQYGGRSYTFVPLSQTGVVPLSPEADEALRVKYLKWCEFRGGGDCLCLLEDGPHLRAEDRRTLALALALGPVLDETRAALAREALDGRALVSLVVWTVALYCMMWVVPEPTTKALAAGLTVILVGWLGLETVWGLMDGYSRMAQEAREATTFEELRAAGEQFGKVLGEDAARAMILAVATLTGRTLGAVAAKVRALPSYGLAGAQWEAQGGTALLAPEMAVETELAREGALAWAVDAVEAVAVSPRGPLAVVMLKKGAGGAPSGGRFVATVLRHRGGNQQVELGNGWRWHLPRGKSVVDIPTKDPVGDELQDAVTRAAKEWGPEWLTENEASAIKDALKRGKYWLARLLEREARGRFVHAKVEAQFKGRFRFNHQGVDVVDLTNNRKYEILSGTESNLARHGRRMAGEFFRMLTF